MLSTSRPPQPQPQLQHFTCSPIKSYCKQEMVEEPQTSSSSELLWCTQPLQRPCSDAAAPMSPPKKTEPAEVSGPAELDPTAAAVVEQPTKQLARKRSPRLVLVRDKGLVSQQTTA